ncbi:3-phosphoshikimate 1-carboxyvinyltransferase [Actinobaculum suis]|uniref:3-phosphoshikimate 1-carboxyvinyltransferase n=1 Tax=Actinobaculum suis TaxID=1657 RepID=A0A1B9BD02_9ACTO|nr:3-phosphoshikimate 1-carboxyvinyltransferase [Actinobaculum suis]MDY5152964.1 3-phosphoshikimate 1-carboxyvinyltransferase [Actinobaculum suis]OCA94610.1 3-phosphoshikimate 1-carboxyvinyltransferase [Actinobaculum suis]OCA94922.1 3-phosphoshikimate 1-carboxyvinyltransferase [Actinobaculum suis]SDE37013.1 3-phosphoshikimate 1-carboxyvinyltransferase [Actinobaculum suis]
MATLWTAPYHPTPISGTVDVPASKSLMARYFILAALSTGPEPSVIKAPLRARDSDLMAQALRELGVTVDWQRGETEAEDVITISGTPHRGATIDAGLAGTVMRFIPPVAALTSGVVHLDGDAGARVRPMDPVVQGLRELGVRIEAATNAHGQAVLPLTVHGEGSVAGGGLNIDSGASSQFISALLLAAPRFEKGLDLRSTGATPPSTPHLNMTCQALLDAGAKVRGYAADGTEVPVGLAARDSNPASRWVVEPGTLHLGEVTVEPDLSNAAPFLAAAMVSGGSVSIPRWPARTTQPGAQIADIFSRMGGRVERSGEVLTLHGPSEILPLDADLHDVGELTPTISAVAAFATGPSRLRNIGQLRGHETDRLAAITAELNRLGCTASISGDDILISPAPMHAAQLQTYADHRMATFAAIIGLGVEGVVVEDVETTAKTMPDFPQMWETLVRGEA